MNLENFKVPVGAAVVITIICILLDYNFVGLGAFTLLTFIPAGITALLILSLVIAGIINWVKDGRDDHDDNI